MKAVQHIVVSSADTIGAFNTGFGRVNLHPPTTAPSKASRERTKSTLAREEK